MSTTADVGAAESPREHGAPQTDPPGATDRLSGGTTTEEPAGAPDDLFRASDAERSATVERLHQALGAGRLDLAETDERVAAAYAARHRHELAALLTDLPATDVVFGEAPSWTALWTLAVWRAWTYLTGAATPRPTSPQLRTAALFVALAVLWVVACALVGAVAVGA